MMSKWNEMNYRIPESSRTVIVCLEKCQINRRAERYLLCLSFRALYFSFVFIQPVLYPQSITSGKKYFPLSEQGSHQVVEPSWRYFNQDSAVLNLDDYVRYRKHGSLSEIWTGKLLRHVLLTYRVCRSKICMRYTLIASQRMRPERKH